MTDQPRISAPFEVQFDQGRMQEWLIQQMIRKINTCELVKVLAVYPTTDTVGFVDVQPLIQDRTTLGVVLEQAPTYKLPYFRLQGGISAVILDPVVGDIGLAAYAQRDITNVVATRDQGAAPTDRVYDAGDGLYFGGFLNADPTQYVKFLPTGGIEVVSTADLSITAPGNLTADVGGNLTLTVGGDAAVTVGGKLDLTVEGDMTVSAAKTTWGGVVTFSDGIVTPEAKVNGINLSTHRHQVTAVGSPTGAPIA